MNWVRIGHARNAIYATTCGGLIVIAGGLGTLSEADFALNLDKPVAAIKNTGGVADSPVDIVIDGRRIIPATSATETVKLVLWEIKSK